MSEAAVERVRRLERQVHQLRIMLGLMVVIMVVGIGSAWTHEQAPGILRARQLLIVDSLGRDRMTVGPLSDFGGQRAPQIGIAIDDENGNERFGLGLRGDGHLGMGFDAPLGKGDDRNRQRINIIADEQGGAQIRFLDKQTFVKARLRLTDDNRVVAEFLDFPPHEVRVRQLGFGTDTLLRAPR